MIERRSTPRTKVRTLVDVCVEGATSRAFVYDISIDGCSLHFSEPFGEAGRTILIRFPGGECAEGTMAWQSNGTAGVHFNQSLLAAVVAMNRQNEWKEELQRELGQDQFGRRTSLQSRHRPRGHGL